MKKKLNVAAIASVLCAPAFAANLENPLYTPTSGEVYSRTGFGVMYKKTDNTESLKAKNRNGKEEAPIWRYSESIGYGITDRLSVNANLGYTNDEDVNRQGLHNGRIGLLYRIFDGTQTPFVWDIYGDLHLGGMGTMKATVVPVSNNSSLGFDYANYTNGRWGFFAGTKIGKTWDKFTASAFGEIHQTYGNHNNEISISDSARTLVAGMITIATTSSAVRDAYAAGMPGDFNVKLKSTTEMLGGVNGFYQFNDDWSFGGGFSHRHRTANTIESVNLSNSSALPAATKAALTKTLADGFIGTLDDGLDEYILSAAVSRKLSESVQISVYSEYTFDDADAGSQNGSDIKAEVGIRANVAF